MPDAKNRTDRQKQRLRRQMKARRAAIGQDEARRAARAVIGHVDTWLKDEKTVGLYYPVRHEFDCLPLGLALAKKNISTALPMVVGSRSFLQYHPWKPGQPVERGRYDIPVPSNRGLSIQPDVLIVPLLAFDASGGRLGYGGGYYDRTLQDFRKQNEELMAIGLAYDFQQLPVVPVAPHDQPLDFILTPSKLLEAERQK